MYRLVGRLGPLFVHRGRTRGVVVLGAPEGDYHGLATALVADVLRGRRFSVADLGGNTPAASFAEAVATSSRLVGTGVVVSSRVGASVLGATVAAIKTAGTAPVLLGGIRIRSDEQARRLGADAAHHHRGSRGRLVRPGGPRLMRQRVPDLALGLGLANSGTTS